MKSNGKILHLFIPSKTSLLVPECVMEDLLLDRTVTLVPGFAVKDSCLLAGPGSIPGRASFPG